jgi:2-polyprenyl-3-methyl-5-hydroxy-6-metoxy-1,4-benzoquinol methylase
MTDLRAATEEVPCNLCGSTDHQVVYPATPRDDADLAGEFRSSGDEPLKERLVACRRCGLQFVSPRLRSDLILAGYSEGSDEVFVSQASARERTFARSLHLIEARAPQRGRLLDIGTAAGTFMHAAAQRGWTVSGCEPNRWLCEWGRTHYGLDIEPGTVFDQRYADAEFDVVTVWDVLEHVEDPRRFLDECHRILGPGGLLVVNYPDIGSWIARVMGRRWVFLISVHLYYFTRRTIAEMLRRTGFEVIEMRPHVQRLEAQYVLKRAESAAGIAARAARRAVSAVGLGQAQVPYWIGQTLVLARRVPAKPA